MAIRSLRSLGLLVSLLVFAPISSFAQTGTCGTVISGNPLPDLTVDPNRLANEIVVTKEKFAASDCAVVEGCVTGKGSHQLLRFTSSTPNSGKGELVIGNPLDCPNLFQQSACHNHLHFKTYTDYRLWSVTGYANWQAHRDLTQPAHSGTNATLLAEAMATGDLVVGRKQGFCIIDTDRIDGDPTRKYTTCGTSTLPGNQGLQVGWADTYGQQLDCQYVQIDKLAAGNYVLEVQANPEQMLPEADYTNDSSAVKFQFVPAHGRTPAQTIIVP